MKPNEKVGMTIVIMFFLVTMLVTGAVSHQKGFTRGKDTGYQQGYTQGQKYNSSEIFSTIEIDNYLVDGKKNTGGTKYGRTKNQYSSTPSKNVINTARSESEDTTPARPDSLNKPRISKNLFNMGRIFQIAWCYSVTRFCDMDDVGD